MRLIDADELLTAFPVDDEPTVTKACIRMTIQNMPTIEPKQGVWIKHDTASYRCSKCGKIQIADDMNELNYCCCCGSKNRIKIKSKRYDQ